MLDPEAGDRATPISLCQRSGGSSSVSQAVAVGDKKQNCSLNQASKLKNSSAIMSKVPAAKSRLKQPVASMAIGQDKPVASAAAPTTTSTRSAKSASRAPRPTSLALRSPTSLKSSEAPRVYTSILPKLTLARPSNSLNTTTNATSSITKKPAATGRPQQQLAPKSQIRQIAATATSSQSQQLDRRKSTVAPSNGKQQASTANSTTLSRMAPTTTSSVNGAFESRLKGLKSLVAAVRSQQSNSTNNSTSTTPNSRVNSSPSSKSTVTTTRVLATKINGRQQATNGKSCSALSAGQVSGPPAETASQLATKGGTTSIKTAVTTTNGNLNSGNGGGDTEVKLASGLVDSKHKDVNGKTSEGGNRATAASVENPQTKQATVATNSQLECDQLQQRRGRESKQDVVGVQVALQLERPAQATTTITNDDHTTNGQLSRVSWQSKKANSNSRSESNSPQCLTRIQADKSEDQIVLKDHSSSGRIEAIRLDDEGEFATRDKKQQADGKQCGGGSKMVIVGEPLHGSINKQSSNGKVSSYTDHSDKEVGSGSHLLTREYAGQQVDLDSSSPSRVNGKWTTTQADGANSAGTPPTVGGDDETLNNYYNARNLCVHLNSSDGNGHDEDGAVATSLEADGTEGRASVNELKLGNNKNSPAIQFKCNGNNRAPHDNNNCNNNISAHAINNNLIHRKPMGHQVLSLMMLNVGLVPTPPNANNQHEHSGDHHLGKHRHLDSSASSTTSNSKLKRSYVRIQDSDSRRLERGDCDYEGCSASRDNDVDGDVNSCFIDNQPSRYDHDKRGLMIDTAGPSSNRSEKSFFEHNYRKQQQQSNDCRSLRNCATPEIGLQVHFGNNTYLNNYNSSGSISLPSSPRRMRRATRSGTSGRQQTPPAVRRAVGKSTISSSGCDLGDRSNTNSSMSILNFNQSYNHKDINNKTDHKDPNNHNQSDRNGSHFKSDYSMGNKKREELERAIEALSISCDRSVVAGNQFATNHDQLLTVSYNQPTDSRSQASSSCLSLNHCSPLFSLSNELNGFKFSQLGGGCDVTKSSIGGKGGGCASQVQHQFSQSALSGLSNGCNKNNREAFAAAPVSEQIDTTRASLELELLKKTNSPPDQIAQVTRQHQLLTNDLNVGIELRLHGKIDHVDACNATDSPLVGDGHLEQPSVRLYSGETKKMMMPALNIDNNEDQQQQYQCSAAEKTASATRLISIPRDSPIGICNGNESGLAHHSTPSRNFQASNMDQQSSQRSSHPQQRSNSICGQDFQSSGSYQRLKHSICNSPSVFDDHLSRMTQHRLQNLHSPFQQLQAHHLNQSQQQVLPRRTPSPINMANYSSLCDNSTKYASPDNRQLRTNYLHTSLECLNLSDHQYSPMNRVQRAQQQSQKQPNLIPTNQHYATSYVLAPPPVNTIINQNGEQDLAAAAMGIPSHYQSSHQQQHQQAQCQQQPSPSDYASQTQTLISRALAQVTHSPYRRMTSSNIVCNQNQTSQTSSSHPIRTGHSSLSLASSSYVLEDKLHSEIKKLQKELQSEKEKNEALNSQLNINSSLMSAFEQSLTTLNSRLRQLSAINEKKDNEITELREHIQSIHLLSDREGTMSKSPVDDTTTNDTSSEAQQTTQSTNDNSEKESDSERYLLKTIEDLKKQLIEKDRLLTDTRLEALSAAHQLEQLESKLNGEHSLLVNEDDLDEGVNLINHSPSESDATTDSAHFSEMNNQLLRSNLTQKDDLLLSQVADSKDT